MGLFKGVNSIKINYKRKLQLSRVFYHKNLYNLWTARGGTRRIQTDYTRIEESIDDVVFLSARFLYSGRLYFRSIFNMVKIAKSRKWWMINERQKLLNRRPISYYWFVISNCPCGANGRNWELADYKKTYKPTTANIDAKNSPASNKVVQVKWYITGKPIKPKNQIRNFDRLCSVLFDI
jgi:hypothetical protein